MELLEHTIMKPYFSDALVNGFIPKLPLVTASYIKTIGDNTSLLNELGRYSANVSLFVFPTGIESTIVLF